MYMHTFVFDAPCRTVGALGVFSMRTYQVQASGPGTALETLLARLAADGLELGWHDAKGRPFYYRVASREKVSA